jgi:hypothetical protein
MLRGRHLNPLSRGIKVFFEIKPSGSLENPKVKKSPVNGALNLIE